MLLPLYLVVTAIEVVVVRGESGVVGGRFVPVSSLVHVLRSTFKCNV